MTNLPEKHQHGADCGCYRPDSGMPVLREQQHVPEAYTGPQIVHQHVHQAPPDRTVQRLALGSGMGGGAVAAAVFLGPMLVAAITAITAQLAVLALLVAVCAWAIVTVVKAVSGGDRRKG